MTDAWLVDVLGLLPALLGGTVLGAVFYGGLWWTVRRGLLSSRPALWFFGSLAARTGIVLAGIWLIGDRHGERLVMCLLGFLMARLLVTRIAPPMTVRFDGHET